MGGYDEAINNLGGQIKILAERQGDSEERQIKREEQNQKDILGYTNFLMEHINKGEGEGGLDEIKVEVEILRELVIKLTEILTEIAIEKGLIEPPKPKTPGEKLKEVTAEVRKLEEEESEEIEERNYSTCLKCRKRRKMVNIKKVEKKNGLYNLGECEVCGTKMARKIPK